MIILCQHINMLTLMVYMLVLTVCQNSLEIKAQPVWNTKSNFLSSFFLLRLCQDILQTVLDVLTPDDVRVLAESEDELSRRGQFERVFPSSSSSRYLRFFECPRYHNILLDQWEQKHWSNRSKGWCVSEMYCTIKSNINLFLIYQGF